MAHFRYTAEKAGEVYSGSASAHDRFELYQVIRREGGTLVSYTEDSSRRDFFSFSYWNARFSSVPEQEKILFVRNLGAMLHAGLSLSRALSVIERQTKQARVRLVVSELENDVRRGSELHAALAKFPHVFSRLVAAMVRAGEEGGDLPSSLQVLSEQMERASSLKKKIKSAMIYPSIILVVIFGIGALMMIEVVPTLAQTFEEVHAQLPLSTQIIIWISNFLVQYTALAAALVVFLGAVMYFSMRTPLGRQARDLFFLHVPLIGTLAREVNAARTSRTLASLLSAGVDVLAALDITGEVVQNHYFTEVIKDAGKAVGKGEPLSSAFARREDLYPAFVGEMMAVGEETGQSAEMLKRLAEYYEAEVDRKTKDMSTIIEPFLMVFIGAAVGFFAVSMIQPIYSLSQTIG